MKDLKKQLGEAALENYKNNRENKRKKELGEPPGSPNSFIAILFPGLFQHYRLEVSLLFRVDAWQS